MNRVRLLLTVIACGSGVVLLDWLVAYAEVCHHAGIPYPPVWPL